MRMRPLPALLLASTLAAGPAMAQAELQSLLDGLAPERPPEGRVEVQGWLERDGERAELVVTLLPHGAAKLVADPGITVTPLNGAGPPLELVDPSRDYLAEPPLLRLPLPGHSGGPVVARVDYAYCLVDYQCLFGEATVRAGGPAEGCDADSAVC
jgi:hypothetical protein